MPAKHQPTDQSRATVESMTAYGMPQDEICRVLGVSGPTLRKHYREEIETASAKANSRVGQFLYSLASGMAIAKGATFGDCRTAAIFWAKTRMRWVETDRHEHTGKDGGPIQTEDVTSDASNFARRMASLAARSDADGADEADGESEG